MIGPIIMTGESVVGIIKKSKTQTRRVITPQPDPKTAEFSSELVTEAWLAGEIPVKCPYGKPGDRLWVRETWCTHPQSSISNRDIVFYRADVGNTYLDGHWKSPMFMPRWASRITLEIVGVRVERVQDISGEDAAAEGIALPRCGCEVCIHSSQMCPADQSAHILAYAEVWDKINAKRRFGWEVNPWVWVLEFRKP